MAFLKVLKSILALGVLICMSGAASAQYDLDVDNQTGCNFTVKFLNDDGLGTCTTCGNVITSPAYNFSTFSCGATSGAVYLVAITDGSVPAVYVGDCSLTSCSPCSLPGSNAIFGTCGTWNIVYYPPGTMTTNAYVLIY